MALVILIVHLTYGLRDGPALCGHQCCSEPACLAFRINSESTTPCEIAYDTEPLIGTTDSDENFIEIYLNDRAPLRGEHFNIG